VWVDKVTTLCRLTERQGRTVVAIGWSLLTTTCRQGCGLLASTTLAANNCADGSCLCGTCLPTPHTRLLSWWLHALYLML
jgi:hypothetical protein